MARIAVLLGHGVFDADADDYKKYIGEFADFVNKNNVDSVIISGGRKAGSKFNEAESMKELLLPLLKKPPAILVETKSINSLQSIKNTKPLISLKKSDDITVFCKFSISVKVMWFIMHYWFGLDRAEIERDALNYIGLFFSKRKGIKDMGKSMLHDGLFYENVEVHAVPVTPTVESALAQQLISLVDVSALYNKQLYDELIMTNEQRFVKSDIARHPEGLRSK